MLFEAIFGQLDMRFHQHDKEASFKKNLEPDLLCFGSVGGLAGCFWAVLCLTVRYGMEAHASGDASPIGWASDDPRTWHFVLLLAVAASFGGGGACLLLQRRRACLQALDLEALAMCTLLIGILLFEIGNRRAVSQMFGFLPNEVWFSGDARVDESDSSIFASGAVVYTCLFVPIRSHLLWLLPVFALGPALAMRAAWGSPFNEAFPADLILLSLTSGAAVCCAWRNEWRSRLMWDATWGSQKSPGKQAFDLRMEDVAEALCDVVVELDDRMQVWHASEKVTEFFGGPVEGMLFTELLSAEDRGLFEALARESSPEPPACSPTALGQETLLLKNTGHDLPRYLVGVKRERSAPRPRHSNDQADGVDDYLSILPNLLPRDGGGHQEETTCAPLFANGIKHKEQRELGTRMDPVAFVGGAVTEPALDAAAPTTRESGTQVDPVATVERSGNTSITWGEFGFTCRICTSRADADDAVADPVFAEPSVNRHSFNWDVARSFKGDGNGTRKKKTMPTPSCSDAKQPSSGCFGVSAGPDGGMAYSSECSWQDSYISLASSDAMPYAEPCAHKESTTVPERFAAAPSGAIVHQRSSNSEQSFDGDWVLRDNVPVESWLRCLTINGKEVIDGNGELQHLRRKSKQLVLKGGVLDLVDDILYRYDNVDIDIAYVRSKPYHQKYRG